MQNHRPNVPKPETKCGKISAFQDQMSENLHLGRGSGSTPIQGDPQCRKHASSPWNHTPLAVDEGDEWTAAAARRAAGARCRHASGEEQLVAEAATPAVSGAGRGVGDGRTTPARDLVAGRQRKRIMARDLEDDGGGVFNTTRNLQNSPPNQLASAKEPPPRLRGWSNSQTVRHVGQIW